VAIAVTSHNHIGVEFVFNIFMGRCHQRAALGFRHQSPQVEGQHFGQWSIEQSGEFISHDASSSVRRVQRNSNSKPRSLAIGQLGRRAEC
jgi:hypothetical protein